MKIEMDTSTFRTSALRLSQAREFVLTALDEDQIATHSVEDIVADLAAWSPRDWEFTASEWARFIAPHEFDARGVTDAALAKALKNSQTGWVALIRRPDGDVQTMNLKKGVEGTTPETIEGILREFVNFPEGTSISILPLVG
jgi:hypothetical protein